MAIIRYERAIFGSNQSRIFGGVCRNLIMSYKESNWYFSASVIRSSDHVVKKLGLESRATICFASGSFFFKVLKRHSRSWRKDYPPKNLFHLSLHIGAAMPVGAKNKLWVISQAGSAVFRENPTVVFWNTCYIEILKVRIRRFIHGSNR